MALKTRLKSYASVDTEIYCGIGGLLQGTIESARIHGAGWHSPLDLTAQLMELRVGRVSIDMGMVVSQRRIILKDTPLGTARVVFSAQDFTNFLAHPMMKQAAARAVQGQPFLFDRSPPVEVLLPAAAPPTGAVLCSGSWSGCRYQVVLVPAPDGRSVRVHATPHGAEAQQQSAHNPASPSSNTQGHQEQQQHQHAHGHGRSHGKQHHHQAQGKHQAVEAPHSHGSNSGSGGAAFHGREQQPDPLVSSALTAFFNGLMVDLQGAELRFASMRVVPRAQVPGVAGPADRPLVDLSLALRVRSFPPPTLKF